MDALMVAQELADRGQFDAAVEIATIANRRERSAALERNIALWRCQAFPGLDRSQERAEWPPVFADLFSGTDTVPELPAAQLDVAHLGGGITRHGALIVRGLLSAREADYFVDGIDQAMAERDAGDEKKATDSCWHCEFPLPPTSKLGFTRPWLRSLGGLLLADSPRMLFDLMETLKHKRIDRLIGDYLGERPVVSVGKSTLRRVSITAGVDWHQDGAFLGGDTRTVNLWIALTDCGVDAPGLDIVPRRLNGIVGTGSHGAEFDWSVGNEMAMKTAAGRAVVSPHFRAGDAIFFDQLLLHRTGVRPCMVRERWAIETWFFAPSTYPMEQVPLVI